MKSLAVRRPRLAAPPDLYTALVAPQDAELSLAVLGESMYADGEVSPQEREALRRMGGIASCRRRKWT